MSVIESGAAERPPLAPEQRPKLDDLRARLQTLKTEPGATLEALYAAQELFTYIPPEAITMIAEELRQPESQVFGVVTFYTMLYLDPQPKLHLRVCRDLSCHLAGAQQTIQAFEHELGIRRGEPTADGEFKLEAVSCLGLCDLQPAMLVNVEAHGPVPADTVPDLLREIRTRDA
jgi:NADH:ubiquinone oxidoreductase subunit E